MSTLTLTSKKIHASNTRHSHKEMAAKAAEAFWFTLSFLLFLAMGPFAAIPALIGVFSLKASEDTFEPEMAEKDEAEGSAL